MHWGGAVHGMVTKVFCVFDVHDTPMAQLDWRVGHRNGKSLFKEHSQDDSASPQRCQLVKTKWTRNAMYMVCAPTTISLCHLLEALPGFGALLCSH